MKHLIERYRRYLGAIGIAGLVLLLGGFDLAVVWLQGVRFDDLHLPLGRAVAALASQFTPAPSLTRAGSERRERIYLLFLAASAARSLLFAWLAREVPAFGVG